MILHGLQTKAGVFLLGVDLLCTVSLTKHVLGTGTVGGAGIMEREDTVTSTQR